MTDDLPIGHAEICKAVNDTPALQSLLYDLNLLPEQTGNNPKKWFYTVTATNHFIVYGDAREAAARERADRLQAALINLKRAYVRLMEAGRDRIIMHGGQCDPVDVMEASDPYLRDAADAIRQSPS